MNQELGNYLQAGYPGIYIVSVEEIRVEAILKAVVGSLGRSLYAWSATEGLVDTSDGSIENVTDPIELLSTVSELNEGCVVLLRDFHLFLESPDPYLLRAIRDLLIHAKGSGKTLVMLGCRMLLPPELEREWVVSELSLPGKVELQMVLENVRESASMEELTSETVDQVIDAASGLTCLEAENTFALSIVSSGQICHELVSSEKARSIAKTGLVEIVNTPGCLDDIGGLDLLKRWLVERKDAFSERAMTYRLPTPKGLLIVGIPGTGKSLTAKATASVFGRPLLKLDAGRLFGGMVGQSEANLRSAIQTAEAIAPCVVWIDEIEKGFQGSASSGYTDGGTSARVLGSFLAWMQEKTKPVFVVATANDIAGLPPEFLRKGRFDELFFIDLPGSEEREAIWRIQIKKLGRDPEAYDIQTLAFAAEGLTGAEIEQAFIDGLYAGFAGDREPNTDDLIRVLSAQVPLSRLMKEKIEKLHRWARERTRPATSNLGVEGRKVISVNN